MDKLPNSPPARRLFIFNQCVREHETLKDAYAAAWEIECFITCGVDPGKPETVSREKAREEILRLTLEGVKPRAIKNTLGLSKDAVYRHLVALRKEGKLPGKGNGLAESRTGLEVE